MTKRILSLLLISAFLLSLSACGADVPAETTTAAQIQETILEASPETQPEEAPVESVPVDPALAAKVQDMITQFCADEQYLTAAQDYENAIGSTPRSPYLHSAMEHQIDDPQGISTHVLLVDLKADVAVQGGIIFDHVQLLLDLDTDDLITSLSPKHLDWAGEMKTKEDLHFALLNSYYGFQPGGIFFTQMESYTAFSDEAISSINTALGLSYMEHSWEVETEPLTTTDEERLQLVTDTAQQFCLEKGNTMLQDFASFTGAEADTFTVAHAMEYRIGSWDGYPVHLILMALKGNVGYGDGLYDRILVMKDLETGAIYDESMIPGDFYDRFDGTCRSEEDLPWTILSLYAGYLHGNPWLHYETEVLAELSQAQLDAVTAALQ